ncbi:MAG: hypothetical protein A2622_06140 [Bdellovibrionales bacterium RIFCSPHIGHO2_01_FULL_40_29]|nr:MAG: hypothetical protein A2622_06140 [Bdellovibrionales bacterium RIFCSPHIGHO2_01_FULL_40_29]OFZ35029.1 MAG: hypothetical protein A3D17_06490 [Bdellovibrionales bacterium RIFCSPHIGHO2_02_FULL_40_15]
MPQDEMTIQQQFPQLFQQGLADQQNKKWDDALGKYQTLLDQSQNSLTNTQASVVYHNMAVCAFEKVDLAKTYIWSKKAITLNSRNQIAQDFYSEISQKFQPPQVPHQISAIESLQKVALKNVSMDTMIIVSFILLSASFYLGLKNWLIRRQNRLEAESTSTFKKNPLGLTVGFASMVIFTSLVIFLLAVKWTDFKTPKALIAIDKTLVQTASGGNQAVIYDAGIGLEVDVLKIEADFVQIRFPGAFSGWVKKENLEILTAPNWLSAAYR